MAIFTLVFLVGQRPWPADDPRAKEHIGIGAFNLLRREVYLKLGTHQAIAMRPDDDLKLDKLVKKHGFKRGWPLGPICSTSSDTKAWGERYAR